MNVALTRALTPYYRFRAEAAGTPARERSIGERLSQVVIVVLFTSMAVRMARDTAVSGHVTGLLLVVGEALVVALTIIRRPPGVVDRSFMARLLTGVGTFLPPLVHPASNAALTSDALTVMISGVGLTVVLLGKLSLGRSFGLAPANRGVVSTGVYRYVRHPIYLGYLITHVGFVIANAITWNLMVLLTADIALLLRAMREERTLALDGAYCAYMRRVRWHILPGVF